MRLKFQRAAAVRLKCSPSAPQNRKVNLTLCSRTRATEQITRLFNAGNLVPWDGNGFKDQADCGFEIEPLRVHDGEATKEADRKQETNRETDETVFRAYWLLIMGKPGPQYAPTTEHIERREYKRSKDNRLHKNE